jgi:hypothetical protein
MTSRFLSNLIATLGGGLLVIASLTFGPGALEWLALALSATVLCATLIAFAFRGRGATQRKIDVTVATVSSWTILAACAFAGASLKWLSFAGGAALCALGVLGLIVHEAVMERPIRTVVTAEPVQDGVAPRTVDAGNPTRSPVGAA